jgi:hypothetical protein
MYFAIEFQAFKANSMNNERNAAVLTTNWLPNGRKYGKVKRAHRRRSPTCETSELGLNREAG